MKQNIGRGEFSQFPNLSQTICQEDAVLTYVQHLNALYADFKIRFEDMLNMVIPQWIINPYGDVKETDVILQEELIRLSTNEEVKAVAAGDKGHRGTCPAQISIENISFVDEWQPKCMEEGCVGKGRHKATA
ncbi:hypothetical protein NQ318_016257 [Aromia moschata]|uniref:Uncharacterized protein n=1 Tax=Aromia moschata TaxID=1265417 RepID=A0AAV8XCN5_9CUCU|nr:hypothetical protein NQ318_016257 [Aromia moschata]